MNLSGLPNGYWRQGHLMAWQVKADTQRVRFISCLKYIYQDLRTLLSGIKQGFA